MTQPDISDKKRTLSELQLRIISSAILAPLVLIAVWLGGLAFLFLVVVAMVIGVRELQNLFLPADLRPKWLDRALILSMMAVAGCFAIGGAGWGLLALGLSVATLYGAASREKLPRAGEVALGFAYLAGSGLAMLYLRADTVSYGQTGNPGLMWIILLFVIIWATDIGAYFGGRSIGGPKLAPRLSPNKTWSGAFSGLFFAVIFTLLLVLFTGAGAYAITALALAGILSAVSQAGDFLESGLKRRAGLKDSGQLIPGHGGLLDRIDGLMPAAIVMALFHAVLLGGMRWWG